MKFAKTFLACLIIFYGSPFCLAQLQDKAELIDEFTVGKGCEGYWAVLDIWLYHYLVKDRDSVGYVVLQGKKDDVLQTIAYKEMVGGHLERRKLMDAKLVDFDVNRIKVLRGADAAELKVQFWKSAGNGEKPAGADTNFDYALKLEKPTVFYDGISDGICASIDELKVFGDFIRANPELRGNIVIYKNAERGFRKAKSDILNRLNGISPSRLRFFYSSNAEKDNFELWFLPQRIK